MDRPVALLVESDPGMDEVLRLVIEQLERADVEVVRSVEDAKELVGRLAAGIVLVDDDAPAGSGTRMLAALQDAGMTDIPVVAMSWDSEDAFRLLAAGCSVYLRKPCHPESLADVIDVYVNLSSSSIAKPAPGKEKAGGAAERAA